MEPMSLDADRLKEHDSLAEGQMPSHEKKMREEQEREKEIHREIDETKGDIDTALMLNPENPEAQALKSEMMGANAKNTDLAKLERVAREAREEASKEMQKTVATGMALLIGIGSALAMFGVKTDGKNYPLAMLGGSELMGENAGLPSRAQDGHGMSFNSMA